MTAPPPELAPALDAARRGDFAAAADALDGVLAGRPDHHEALVFAGLVAARLGDPVRATGIFERLLALTPGDTAMRGNLAEALIATGDHARAADVASGGASVRLLRIRGYAEQQLGELAAAATSYRAALAQAPEDFESWNNLGNVAAADGDVDGAIQAFEQAITLRRDSVPAYLNLARLLGANDRREARLKVARDASAVAPEDREVALELGLAEAAAANADAAEAALRRAIAIAPELPDAYLELGLLLENRNRLDTLGRLIEDAAAAGVGAGELALLRAWLLRRRGEMEAALALAEAIPETINPIRTHQLIAELSERRGDAGRAMIEFTAMNAASAAAAGDRAGPSYLEEVRASAARFTPGWFAGWRAGEPAEQAPAPVFIVGFPRSGTTLLDTLMMNLPSLAVMEEQPALAETAARAGPEEAFPGLDPLRTQLLRAGYLESADRSVAGIAGRIVVDKHPLHMTRVPLIHRLFPAARIVLVERHPCDAVLSCFMANFQPNRAMRSFFTLEGAAALYDAAFTAWTRATAALPVAVHRVRYERMIADLEGEMRALMDFLELPWNPAVLDNQGSAARRDQIRTASYAQVGEPIYTRAVARWERYRDALAPVMPVLAPWAERMGYPL